MRTGLRIISFLSVSGSGRCILHPRYVGVLGFGLPKNFMMTYERNLLE